MSGRPRVEAGHPRLLEQLLMLPPTARIAAGALMLGMGLVSICMLVALASLVLLGLGVSVGLPLVISGLLAKRQRAVEDAERQRAEAELPELRKLIAAAVAARQGVSRLLRQRGYQSARVRRWIALECDVVLRD